MGPDESAVAIAAWEARFEIFLAVAIRDRLRDDPAPGPCRVSERACEWADELVADADLRCEEAGAPASRLQVVR